MKSNLHYGARSKENLEDVCKALSEVFSLPPFTYDSHGTWRYAWSGGEYLRLNVTQARDRRTIETWIPNSPSGVNYQVILTAPCEPPNFTAQVAAILHAEIVRYGIHGATEPGEEGQEHTAL